MTVSATGLGGGRKRFIPAGSCLAQHAVTPTRQTVRKQTAFVVSPLPAAATFMEHWKRKQMRLNYRWDLTGFEEEEVSEGHWVSPAPTHY